MWNLAHGLTTTAPVCDKTRYVNAGSPHLLQRNYASNFEDRGSAIQISKSTARPSANAALNYPRLLVLCYPLAMHPRVSTSRTRCPIRLVMYIQHKILLMCPPTGSLSRSDHDRRQGSLG